MTPKELAALIPIGPETKTWLEAIRRELLNRTLIETRGNQSEAAKLLGMHRNTLRTILEKVNQGGCMPRVKSQEPAHYTITDKARELVQQQADDEILRQAAQILQRRVARQSNALTSPSLVGELLCARIGGNAVESFGVLYLDSQHRLIELEELFTGTVNGCSVSVPHIIRQCVLERAAAMILYHNHPSGCVNKHSKTDEHITKAICASLKLLDIAVLDHIIVGGTDYISLREHHAHLFE